MTMPRYSHTVHSTDIRPGDLLKWGEDIYFVLVATSGELMNYIYFDFWDVERNVICMNSLHKEESARICMHLARGQSKQRRSP
jgi:hypothetical protein